MKIFILVMFILMYVLIIAIPNRKAYITGIAALIATVACVMDGKMIWHEPISSAINYNVVMMLVGIMITVGRVITF